MLAFLLAIQQADHGRSHHAAEHIPRHGHRLRFRRGGGGALIQSQRFAEEHRTDSGGGAEQRTADKILFGALPARQAEVKRVAEKVTCQRGVQGLTRSNLLDARPFHQFRHSIQAEQIEVRGVFIDFVCGFVKERKRGSAGKPADGGGQLLIHVTGLFHPAGKIGCQ